MPHFGLEESSDRTVGSGARRGKAKLRCLQLESVRYAHTIVERAGQRMRNDEKSAAIVEQARRALATAEQNRDANEKALAAARSHVRKTRQEHFARFPHGCPLDNDVGAEQGVVLASAASYKDTSGDVAMGDVDCVVIEHPRKLTRKPEDLWKKHSEPENLMWQLRGGMGAQAAELHACPDQSADDEEVLNSEQDSECFSILFANIMC